MFLANRIQLRYITYMTIFLFFKP